MQETHYPHDSSPDLDALYGRYTATFEDWLELSNDVECWTDALKHCAMRLAWQAYEDAQRQYLGAIERDIELEVGPGRLHYASAPQEILSTDDVHQKAGAP